MKEILILMIVNPSYRYTGNNMFNAAVVTKPEPENVTIIPGRRGESFRKFLKDLLKMTNLKDKYITKILDNYILEYEKAFTHISADPQDNYEYFEILGDVTANKCIVWYISNRFPQLQNTPGVKVIARLRINLVSKKNFSSIADAMGFADYVSCSQDIKDFKMKSILEDVFEAFIGCTEMIIDSICGAGSGYSVCYRFIQCIFDRISISLKYEDLYDAITRLKETFDHFRSNGKAHPHIWGVLKWENTRKEDGQHAYVYQIDAIQPISRKVLLGYSVGATLDEAKQNAATLALDYLHSIGVYKPVNEYYKTIINPATSDLKTCQ